MASRGRSSKPSVLNGPSSASRAHSGKAAGSLTGQPETDVHTSPEASTVGEAPPAPLRAPVTVPTGC
ncbi:hypothetical protein [Nonomuraea jabiensis]|uniref:Uncharacterized protein n=1 Tax=Nonomuraea jabiensis TaxID=882448 RepID=A0A7W9LI33_9ACTN|nr:hypothetical protein [Nonomuraea jabiensis]MBB5784544.1 hypothetical protein [Nonomuraea jabiensis]